MCGCLVLCFVRVWAVGISTNPLTAQCVFLSRSGSCSCAKMLRLVQLALIPSSTLNPKAETLNPKPETLNPKPLASWPFGGGFAHFRVGLSRPVRGGWDHKVPPERF